MLKNVLILPGGTELFSGTGTANAIKSVTLTQCVNSEVELTIGSTCANMLEATLITPNGGLSLTAGDEVTLYKVDEDDTRHKVGVFILEKPTRPTAHTMKLTGYDRVTKLDKDLTEWLKGLDEWPYNILDFAAMVCDACGVTFVPSVVPNQGYAVEQFAKSGVTGRQIMKWIGEVCCRFIRANADGDIEMGWYEPLTTHAICYKEGAFFSVSDDGAGNVTIEGVDIQTSADDQGNVTINSDLLTVTDDGQGNVVLTVQDMNTLVYFQNGLSYEEYSVAPVEAVQIQLADGSDAYRWPEVQEGTNSYVISGNPMLNSTTDTVKNALRTIYFQLMKITYTPCKVSLPAVLDIYPGHIVRIVDKNKKGISMLVMSKQTTGQKDTYECTGSHRRDSTTAQNNQPVDVDAVAQQKVDAQTQEDIFNKLTDGGKTQGVYLKDGLIYINASYIQSGTISSNLLNVKEGAYIGGWTVKNDRIVSQADESKSVFYLASPSSTYTNWIVAKDSSGNETFKVGKDGSVTAVSGKLGGWTFNNSLFYKKSGDYGIGIAFGDIGGTGRCFGLGKFDPTASGWGSELYFSVTGQGKLYARDADIGGTITATAGNIAGWTIGDTSLTAGTFGTQGFVGLYTSYPTNENYRLVIGSKFKVDRDGAITATGGTIGGWTISGDELYGESAAGTVEISPLGVYGPYDDNGTTRYSLFPWVKILTAANSL